ncbi:hypothetical protein [Alloactinosynnema sp. L-07]|uniref:DUF1707 SHOCT-like domain-containing protein n=1 Tax=Alloactinosynnema sp. L-07 TaxID=1653480 RepID=UPI00065EFB3D|nr:DUF1707 domain-containing protein [Alloactinosynnema sp. L-07]CRK60677.1 hypothetical protein [Alloactinosynnema sp. L-07]
MTIPISPRDLRVSDAERNHVVSILQRAIGLGLLSLDEFTVRMDIALASRTRGELNGVLVDLPGVVHPDSGIEPAKPVQFKSTMSSVKREGAWVVPRDIMIRNRMGSTELDFTEAVISHPEIRIEVDVAGGSVDLLMPERATVDAHNVDVVAGNLEDKVSGAQRGSGPHFVVTGSVRAGQLTIRRPTYVRIGSLTIRRPWRISWDA